MRDQLQKQSFPNAVNHRHLRLSAILLAVISFLLLNACSIDPADQASEDVLRSPVFVRIADRVFWTRVAEVEFVSAPVEDNSLKYSPRDEDNGKRDAESLARDAHTSSSAVSGGYLEIVPTAVYEGPSTHIDCLSWRCRAAKLGVAKDLPKRFMLIDRKYMTQLKADSVGNESVFDLLIAVRPFDEKPKTSCPTQGISPSSPTINAPVIATPCYAVFRLSPNVLAVWAPYPKQHETTEAAATRQGQALALVANKG